MQSKRNLLNTAVTLLLIGTTGAAMAEDAPAAPPPLTFNIGVVSLYKASGIDQDVREPKNFRPALQGGADYAADNGLYAGVWASTGKFGNSAKADLEIDLYGGYRGGDHRGSLLRLRHHAVRLSRRFRWMERQDVVCQGAIRRVHTGCGSRNHE